MPWSTSLRLASVVLVVLLAGCTQVDPPAVQAQLPLGGDAPADAPQQNDQVMRVTLLDGKFDASLYEEQPGATQLLVISTGGPYLFEIDNLVDLRELPAYGGTVINVDASRPGDYMIRAYLSSSNGTSSAADTAVLRIVPADR